MNAFEIPGLRFSLPAGVAVPMHRFVSVNAEGNAIVANATTPVIGVSMNETTLVPEGQVTEIADGIVIVEAAGAITAGAAVASNAEGKATTSADGKFVALTNAGAAGELLTVKL